MIQRINNDGFVNRLGGGRGREGANSTIFHVKMTIITFLLTLFDYMSIAFS